MALTVSNLLHLSAGRERLKVFDLAFDSSYPTGGEPLALNSIGLCDHVSSFSAEPQSGYVFDYDEANNKVLVYRSGAYAATFTGTPVTPTFTGTPATPVFTGTAPAGVTLNIKDSDGAAAAGVVLYVHTDEVFEQGGFFGHLEFVSPTNADGKGTVSNGGAGYRIQDDDNAATVGDQLYFDEDGAAGGRFMANLTDARDVYIPLTNGDFLKVTHDANAAASGVAVYFDEDAANTYERLLFVSPTNASGTDTTSAAITMRQGTPAGTINEQTPAGSISAITPAGTINALSEAALNEVDNATNLSTLTGVRCQVIGV